MRTAICIAFSSLLLLFSSNALSKTEKVHLKGQQEIDISYGLASASKLERTFDLSSNYGFPYLQIGPIFGTYRYYTTDFTNIGITIGDEYFKGSYLGPDYGSVGTYKENALTIAAEIQLVYLTTKTVHLYSGIGIGYVTEMYRIKYYSGFYVANAPPDEHYPQSQNENSVTFQLTAFGIRVGHRVGAFAELGFGYKGLINGGLSYILPSRESAKTLVHAVQ